LGFVLRDFVADSFGDEAQDERDHQDADAYAEPRRRAGPERRASIDRRLRGRDEPAGNQHGTRDADPDVETTLRGILSQIRHEHANRGAREHERRPRKQRERRKFAGGPHVPLEPDGKAIHDRRRANDRCDHGNRGGDKTEHPRAHAAVDPIAHTSAATAIAGPMTFKMSTRNSLSGVLGGLTMNACRRKRNASRKISTPR
jgi:hypothetical protein